MRVLAYAVCAAFTAISFVAFFDGRVGLALTAFLGGCVAFALVVQREDSLDADALEDADREFADALPVARFPSF